MILNASNITVRAGDKTLVDNASLTVNAGDLVGLVGPNGAGKSTLLKALLGLRPRDAGTVTVGGQDFDALPARQRARTVAFLPQERRVEWRLSVEQIVLLGRYPHRAAFGGPTVACRQAAADALAAVGARDLAGRPFGVLSGGERTLVLLARTLAVQAPLLLIDEPITALDPYHQIHVMEILRSLARQGTGVLAVIHDLALAARFMNRVVVMNHGGVAGSGATRDMLQPELISSVYGVDFLCGEERGQYWVLPWAHASHGASGSAAPDGGAT